VTSANGSFSARAPSFERLTVESEFADKQAWSRARRFRNRACRGPAASSSTSSVWCNQLAGQSHGAAPDAIGNRQCCCWDSYFWGVSTLVIAAIREHSDRPTDHGNRRDRPTTMFRTNGASFHALFDGEIITRFGRENLWRSVALSVSRCYSRSGSLTLGAPLGFITVPGSRLSRSPSPDTHRWLLWRNCAVAPLGAVAQNKQLLSIATFG